MRQKSLNLFLIQVHPCVEQSVFWNLHFRPTLARNQHFGVCIVCSKPDAAFRGNARRLQGAFASIAVFEIEEVKPPLRLLFFHPFAGRKPLHRLRADL